MHTGINNKYFIISRVMCRPIKRWKEKFPSIHVIMITAHDSYEERKKATKDGADHFISKPFSKEIILNSIVPPLA